MKTHKSKLRKTKIKKLIKSVDTCANHVNLAGMNTEGDSLFVLRDKCIDDIKLKKNELAGLELKLKSLNEFLNEAQPLMMPDAQTNKYAASGLTEAILDSVGSLCRAGKGTVHGVIPSQVRHYLIHHGFPPPPNVRNYTISVNTALIRLTKSNRLKRTESMGGVFYKPTEIK